MENTNKHLFLKKGIDLSPGQGCNLEYKEVGLMVYRKEWIEKNMGISGKTLRVYENRGLLKPARNPINGKYREYSEEDLERIWFIKLFVKLGYSLDEIEDMINASCFDFRESISRKIEKMEEEKERLEQLIGYLKQIKETGLFPIFPQKMGDVKLMEFLDFFFSKLEYQCRFAVKNIISNGGICSFKIRN